MREQDIEKALEKKKAELYIAENELSSREELVKENHILKNRVRELEEALKEEKEKGILKRLFRR